MVWDIFITNDERYYEARYKRFKDCVLGVFAYGFIQFILVWVAALFTQILGLKTGGYSMASDEMFIVFLALNVLSAIFLIMLPMNIKRNWFSYGVIIGISLQISGFVVVALLGGF